MTVSVRVMSAGDGYKYLLRTVVFGDGKRSLSTPLTRHHSAQGTPSGRWMGEGLRRVGEGLIIESDEVTEEQLQLTAARAAHLRVVNSYAHQGGPIATGIDLIASCSKRVRRVQALAWNQDRGRRKVANARGAI